MPVFVHGYSFIQGKKPYYIYHKFWTSKLQLIKL